MCTPDNVILPSVTLQGLISGNIATRRTEYEKGANLGVQPLTSGDKLPLLLELGSKFLHAISPSIDHPAESHAVLIQTILKVGSGTPFSPQLPQHGSGTTPTASSSTSLSRAVEPPSRDLPNSQSSYLSSIPAPTSAFSTQALSQPPRAETPSGAWPWESRKATNSTSIENHPLKSIAIPNLVDSPSLSPSQPTMPTINTTSFNGGTDTASVDRIGGDDPAQAMASLLASSNPFLGEFCTCSVLLCPERTRASSSLTPTWTRSDEQTRLSLL